MEYCPPVSGGQAAPQAAADSATAPSSVRHALPLVYGPPVRAAGTQDVGGTLPTRVITYTYDGLQRLTSAVEQGATTKRYAYGYDVAGNRTAVWENGVQTQQQQYNAANQVPGWSYDAAGNLLSDGTTTYAYDALGRMTSRNGTSYQYNGDGVLVAATTDGVTTRSTQDLAAPLSQVLSDGSTTYLYGLERLRALDGAWYLADALGSVRATLDDSGTPLTTASYDPWGTPQGSPIAPFGFTGELQDAQGLVYLRARWYDPGQGRFGVRDPFAGWAELPASLHPYLYAANDPVRLTDPTGRTWYLNEKEVGDIDNWLDNAIQGNNSTAVGVFGGVASIVQHFLIKGIAATAQLPPEALPATSALGIVGGVFGLVSACENYNLDRLTKIRSLVSQTRNDYSAPHPDAKTTGIAIMYVPKPEQFLGGGDLHALNRINGSHRVLPIERFFGDKFPRSMYPDLVAYNVSDVNRGFHFAVGLPVRVLPPKTRGME